MSEEEKLLKEVYEEQDKIDRDKLEHIFEEQNMLQYKLFKKDTLMLNDTDGQKFINLNCLAIIDEIMEALRETRFKNPNYIKFGWKKTQKLNNEKFKEELVDVFHFFVNLCLVSGMDANELHERYMKKRTENLRRNKDGY